MGTATVDLDINEGDTFIMALELWADQDNTQPIDITNDTFTGSFQIGTKNIPMTITVLDPTINAIEARVDHNSMKDLSSKGRYEIDQLTNGDSFRLIQGNVRVSQEVNL